MRSSSGPLGTCLRTARWKWGAIRGGLAGLLVLPWAWLARWMGFVAHVPNFEGADAFSSMSSASETAGKFSKKWHFAEIKRGSKPLGRVKQGGPLGASIVTSHGQLLLRMHGAVDGKWLK